MQRKINADCPGTPVYFNQPIELIPYFDSDKRQVLAHSSGCGLVWEDVINCEDLEETVTPPSGIDEESGTDVEPDPD